MRYTKQTSMTLEIVAADQIKEIQKLVRSTLGTRLSASNVMSAAITAYHARLLAAGEACRGEN